jgi:class 3 adenylate cyclase
MLRTIGDDDVDAEYALGISILVSLFIISPLIVALIKMKAKDMRMKRRRGEKLIYQMLPKSVVENIQNKKYTSEMFESATVCFTEMDGFKDIARTCKPLDLFDMLSTIYKTFDERIDRYDVYKVETINDSYMVASGLPVRNGNRHVVEIANLCIDIIFITLGILVNHDPQLRQKIRIGIHSGATTAGVVGSKMPRYCLFGETVNVASRMQSTGEQMKIQMTYETKTLLDTLGGFISEMRGQVEVKGKGLMDTYWLLSRC